MSSTTSYRSKHLNSPDLTVTKCLSISARKQLLKSHIDLDTIGRIGKGLHSYQTTLSLQKLTSYSTTLLEKLEEAEELKPPMIILDTINEDQLIKEPIPINSYSKSSASSSHQLLYKIYKTEAKLVRSILESSGFFLTDSHYWNVLWTGSSPQDYMYEDLNPYQKINHFPNSFEITRKDKMSINLTFMQKTYGKDCFDFFPETFVMPDEFAEFYPRFQADKKAVWISKPSCSSRGRGIFLVNNIQEVCLDESCVVSKYIADPYLINGLKFDLRLYVVITSFEPLRIYLYEEGLVRFASEKYSDSKDNKFAYLTNYSVNKKNEKFIQNTDAKADGVGHKWSLTALMKYFNEKGIETDTMLIKIYDLIIKSVISIENTVTDSIKRLNLHPSNCFDLLGFDIILDSSLKPWLLEVNLSPSLATDSPLDFYIKSNLITDTFNLVGIRMKQTRKNHHKKYSKAGVVNKIKNSPYQKQFVKKKEQSMKKIQEILRETLEEYNRKSGFLRIYPCQNGEVYDKFFTLPKYSNKFLYSALFNENFDIYSAVSRSRPLKVKKLDVQNLTFESKIESNRIQKPEEKVLLNGDDLLIEYLKRVMKKLKNLNEKTMPIEIKNILEKFSNHSAWKPFEDSEESLSKKIENRVQEMLKRKKNSHSTAQPRSTQYLKSWKYIILSKYSDEEVSEMLNNCNKALSIELINILFEGGGALALLKKVECPSQLQFRIKTPVEALDSRIVPRRPTTSAKLKCIF